MGGFLSPKEQPMKWKGGDEFDGHVGDAIPMLTGHACDSETKPCKMPRLRTHIYLHMQRFGFDPVPPLLGRAGCNMKKIIDASGGKVRVRGRGSGHLERGEEAQTPLMVAVSAPADNPGAFRLAVQMTLQILEGIEDRYKGFCAQQGCIMKTPCWSFHVFEDSTRVALEGIPLYGSGEKESQVSYQGDY